jgi:hypothetical protein
VYVHGHGQCSNCGNNVEPCCTGANAADEANATPTIEAAPDPSLFPHLFEQLGGTAATVTTDALVFALTQRLGTDLDDARVVIEAAERLGVVQRVGSACHRLRPA